MIGVFIQVNTTSPKAQSHPIGYVICENGCWEWIGGKSGSGYARMYVEGKMVAAHRWMYEREHGPIPKEYECHHVCANQVCVHPAHLEIVTHKEHYDRDAEMQNGVLSLPKACAAAAAEKRARTHCPQGHPYSKENTYLGGGGRRNCRTCALDRAAEGKRRRRERTRR